MKANRLGILVPSANTVIEDEARHYVPADSGFHVARIFQRELTPEALEQMTFDAIAAAELLAHANVSSILYGITAPSFMLGPTYDEDFVKRIERVTQIRTITVAQAIVHELKCVAARRIALATPYVESVTLREVAFLSANGFSVTSWHSLGHKDVAVIGSLPSETVYIAAESVMKKSADVLLLSCTNWPTYDVVDALEKRFKVPVITSNKAGISQALANENSNCV